MLRRVALLAILAGLGGCYVGNECYYDYELSDALGPATFTYGDQTITLKDFPIDLLPYYDGPEEHNKGLRLKIFYSYKEHGKEPVERFAWTEC